MLTFAALVLATVPRFIDVAGAAGLDVTTYCGGPDKDHILESTGNGVLVADYDQDGHMDLFFVNAHRFVDGRSEPHTSVLYRNRGDGTFEDVTDHAGVRTTSFGQGGAVADIDQDGLPDLYVTAFGANTLFRNNGDGTFSDWTGAAGVEADGWSIGASFFDADGDEDPDLLVASYLEATWDDVWNAQRTRRWRGKVEVLDGPKGLPGAANVFYRNDGRGRFTEATAEAGFDAAGSYYSMGIVTLDYDRDGAVDVYVANDSSPNGLYHNQGDGTFEEVGAVMGVAFNGDGKTQGSMGVDAGDVDGDGYLDLVVTNFAHDYYTLYRNLAGGLFLDDSFAYGIALPSFAPLGWGALFLDVDHDADLDLFFANGQIYPQVDEDPSLSESYAQRNQLLLHRDGRYEIAADAGSGLEVSRSSRGAAAVDFDNDGDLDIVVSNEDDTPTLLENTGANGKSWVELTLARGLGAIVTVTADSRRQTRRQNSGGSYASQSDSRLHFGLGANATVQKIEILWPDGHQDEHEGIPSNTRYVLKRRVPPQAIP